ncbi:glycosyltransferase family 2 protein [Oceanospirillum linum]|uniref:Glycosyl transferase family 2 n=1 Tax=Oceanospirillum linum TaxID=966 RepID=A0A1T1H866_OCELI|nr:glycosyltransferase family 2 protein [Oceanospirillum linum]OOV85920.1 glycosyl transferase family 2 [Oceanospirillum linum]SEG51385.1 Glycosyltransferase involved in cell wall bisynthesis [Oleiphilus messinensis]SMP35528.1 Glycosyltransferase involved in cell wall bisynthesis [Oceanospirillum linum]
MSENIAKKDQGAACPKVAILLCTYNGQHFLNEQLDSFSAQSHSNWQVYASDDGSTDTTLQILRERQQSWPGQPLEVLSGPARGFAANFLSLTCNTDIVADYYAYSDQDDIWEADKLERALRFLQSVPSDMPALYCSRTRLVDTENNEIGLSPLFNKKPSFANALMQNIAGGNTMVFNNAARDLLVEAGEGLTINIHDWWVYILITGCGGLVHYDRHPSIRYRQHPHNLIGMNSSFAARYKRILKLWHGHFKTWNDQHITALRTLEHRLTSENRKIIDNLIEARQKKMISRLILIKRCGFYRQTFLGNLGLIFSAIFNKL